MGETSVNVTPGSGGPDIDLFTVDNGKSRQVIVIGDPVDSIDVAPVDSINGLAVDNKTLAPLASTSTHQTDGLQKTQVVGATGNVAVVSSAGGVSVDITAIGASALGQEVSAASIPVVIASDQSPVQTTIVQGGNAAVIDVTGDLQVDVMNLTSTALNLAISTTAATGVGVTATLPAVSGQFHYISFIQIKKYFTVANAASATPLVVTTTNLPGSLAFTFGQPTGVIGQTDEDIFNPGSLLKSSVANTATTIVCPATTGIIWRINVLYFTAP